MVQRGSRHECRRHVATCPEEKVQGYMGTECQSCGLLSFASVGARCSCRLVIQAGVGSVNILPERPSPPERRGVVSGTCDLQRLYFALQKDCCGAVTLGSNTVPYLPCGLPWAASRKHPGFCIPTETLRDLPYLRIMKKPQGRWMYAGLKVIGFDPKSVELGDIAQM